MMGQGCNQLIVDAYVCSMCLSWQSVLAALEAYDTKARRKAVNAVIKQAQSHGGKNRIAKDVDLTALLHHHTPPCNCNHVSCDARMKWT
jgi:hypothetical protein